MTVDEPPVQTRRRCCLYRHFDADGLLLYVGISQNPERRTFQHVRDGRPWVKYAVRVDGVWYDNTAAAEQAEAMAILNEHPVFNWHQLPWSLAKRRRKEYENAHVAAVVPGVEVDPRPTRDAVAQAIRDQIVSGEMPPGSMVGSYKQLAAQWRLGLDSTMRVMATLLEEGWFERASSKGRSYVTNTVPPVRPTKKKLAQMTKPGPCQQDIVKRHVRSLIDSGGLCPGDRVASLSVLAKTLNVSVGVAQNAMEALRSEGLITARRGDGTFVAFPEDRDDAA